jgi:hypothetical protein
MIAGSGEAARERAGCHSRTRWIGLRVCLERSINESDIGYVHSGAPIPCGGAYCAF